MKENLLKNGKESTIFFNDRRLKIPVEDYSHYKPNFISTCKYNLVTFLPKNLFFQLQKLANIYFVVVAILELIPAISNTNGIPSILLPLSLVMAVSAIRDLLEDRKRKKSDLEENTRQCLKLVEGRWDKVSWQDIKIGDLIKILKDEYFPADLVLCGSSEIKGQSYIETKNIDGETNLKLKSSNKETQEFFAQGVVSNFECEIKCEEPNPHMYQFTGLIIFREHAVPLSLQQFLVRGSSLRNTNWIIGLVVYTGHETKIMLNSAKNVSKISSLERIMNKQIFYIFLLQLFVCGFSAIYYIAWYSANKDDTNQYLDFKASKNSVFVEFIITFFTWMLNFTNFVPISLLVTLEMVKFIQAIFIALDLKIYHEPTDTPAKVQSCSLNEELGQINYIFSDKTGTLTCNVMEFRKLSVRGSSFGTDARLSAEEKISNVDFVDPNFEPNKHTDFLLHLACCHSIVIERLDDKIEYRASSPDELALVSAAKFFGMAFKDIDNNSNLEIERNGQIINVKLLNTIEFSSERKRMSVIVRLPNGNLKIMTKGADSVMFERIKPGEIDADTRDHLYDFSKEGLRTLVLAEKELDEEYYNTWNIRFNSAMRDIHKRLELIEQLGEEIEKDLELIGATAIEDKLQDNVPETIKDIKNAGIKVWVLTGDKVETAINIGYSCELLSPSMSLLEITKLHTNDILNEIAQASLDNSLEKGLVVAGDSLLKLVHGHHEDKLIQLADMCKVVMACRVSPQQKAQIVEMIRKNKPEARTLCIGDGANDVSMITAAHVGVGISGLEGQQAARSSDYSISQFSYLSRLMFVHGRECYRRNAILICYNFYKNVLIVMPLFYYGLITTFSGQLIYNAWTYQLFNVTYAALPICIYAVFDREMDYSKLDYSHYSLGKNNRLFTTNVFWCWVLEGFIQAIVICFITIFGMCYASGSSNTGHMSSMWVAATLMYGLIVILVNVKVILFSNSFYWFNTLIIGLSVIFYFFSTFLLDTAIPISEWLDNYNIRGSIGIILKNPNSYIIIMLVTYMCFFLQPMVLTIYRIIKKKKQEKQERDEEIGIGLEGFE
jgi:phospholipid-transporting ATPase